MFENYSKIDFLMDAVKAATYQKSIYPGWWSLWGFYCNQFFETTPNEDRSDLDKLLISAIDVLLDSNKNTELFWTDWLKEAKMCLALYEAQNGIKSLQQDK